MSSIFNEIYREELKALGEDNVTCVLVVGFVGGDVLRVPYTSREDADRQYDRLVNPPKQVESGLPSEIHQTITFCDLDLEQPKEYFSIKLLHVLYVYIEKFDKDKGKAKVKIFNNPI